MYLYLPDKRTRTNKPKAGQMKNVDVGGLLSELKQQSAQNILTVREQLMLLSSEQLNKKNDEKSWSVAECIDHLNKVNAHYLKHMEQEIERSISAGQEPSNGFSSGFIGKRFIKSIQLSSDKKVPTKMRSPGSTAPSNSTLSDAVFDTFFRQQERLSAILQKASKVDLQKNRINSLLGPLVKFRLGDALRLVIYHDERHIFQALKAAQIDV